MVRKTVVNPAIKYLLFFFNVLLWFCGGAIAGLGAWLIYMKEKDIKDAWDFFLDPSILFCLGGCIVFVVSFFGCMGSLRENTCFLKAYFIFLTILLLLELVFGVLVFLFFYVEGIRDQLPWLNPKAFLSKAIIEYREDADLQNSLDAMQIEFKCCGSSNDDEGYKTWEQNDYFSCNETNVAWERCSVPSSCCVRETGDVVDPQCGFGALDPKKQVLAKINTQGCLRGLGRWLEENSLLVGGITLGIILPELVLVALTRSLSDQIRTQRKRVVYRPET